MTVKGGRQVAPSIDLIRKDHVERYRYARLKAESRKIIDAACGVGYGSHLLAEVAVSVIGYDVDPSAIEYAETHYAHERVLYMEADITSIVFPLSNLAVSFETIEHLKQPKRFLQELRASCDELICSVPNQDVIPFNPRIHRYHERHYTKDEFVGLLADSGWKPVHIGYQADKKSRVDMSVRSGATIIVEAH